MKLTQLKWRNAIFLFLVYLGGTVGTRPESILADVFMKPFTSHNLTSPECIRDSNYYLKDLAIYIPWALQMYDASVKIPWGVITGNYKQLGNFDECLRVKSDYGFVGQACYPKIQFEITANNNQSHRDLDLGDLLVNVAIASNATKWTSGKTVLYELMWCVPSTCSHSDVRETLEFALDPLKIEGRVEMEIYVPKESCFTTESILESKTWDVYDYSYIVLLILVAITLVVIGTTYDMIQQNQTASTLNDILTSFSLRKNVKQLLSTERSRDSISSADGVRCISTFEIIWGHSYYIWGTSVLINLSEIPHMHYKWSNMLTLNANIVTDTFLLLSGMLLSYNELKRNQANPDNKWNFKNIIWFYVHRYVRLTSVYVWIIGFYATLFHKINTGPQWDLVVGAQKNFCRESWWTNLLYINNIVKVPEMCMSQSWYLSLDMQLTWLSPLFFFCMRKRYFYIVTGILLLSSFFINFFITFVNQLTGTMLYYKEPIDDVANVYLKIYIHVYTRFGPYVIGYFLGRILYETRGNVKLPIQMWQVIIGWLIAIPSFLLVVFWPRYMYFDTYEYNVWEASFYAGLHRLIFATVIGWIIFCCENNHAGFIKHILSCRLWIPLSKLCFCAYLLHYIFIFYDVGSVRTAGNLTTKDMWYKYITIVVLTFVTSVPVSLCLEMPFQSIYSIIWKQFSGCKQKRKSTTTDKPNVDSIECGNEDKEIFQSNEKMSDESSITCDDVKTEQSDVNCVSVNDVSCDSIHDISCDSIHDISCDSECSVYQEIDDTEKNHENKLDNVR
nr:PREDICTED: nose resistant to fluoxetine protein 6-like [Linepithema humile]